MSIRTKLIFLLLVPTLAFLWFAVVSFNNARVSAAQSTKIASLSGLATTMSSFVHESQKERGFTGGYLGSKGTKLESELMTQRSESDQKIASIHEFFKKNPISELPADIQSAVDHAMTFSDRISLMRSQILNQSIDGTAALGYYSAMNTAFIDAIGEISYESSDDLLARELGAYTNFLKSKERAGQERAVISNTFVLDAFPEGIYAKFISIVGAQENYMDAFLATCSPEARSAYEQVLSDPTFAQVQEYRKVIHANASTGGFGKDPGTWIQVSTARINKLKETEDGLSELILSRAHLIQSKANASMQFIGISTIAIFGITLFFGWFVMKKMIIDPIKEIVVSLDTIARGDLTARLEHEGRDELGSMARSVNTMTASLTKLIREITQSAYSVSSSATEINASADEMAAGLQTQEQQTQQVAAAVEELSQSVNEVASKSADASAASEESQHQAEDGGGIVSSTVEEMEGIAREVQSSARTINTLGEKSQAIGEIIAVINDIADQTNLLALNAAIEAARAGEHGRGFAVVADEVRKLAERTTEATEEVSLSIRSIQTETSSAVKLIEAGSSRVGKGVELATQAGVALESIVDGSQSVQGMVQDIAAAANEQSAATGEIARAIEGINSVTRQSSESASQAAEAAGDLACQAELLQGLVGEFKIE